MNWTRSLLKYPGSKYALLDEIDKLIPKIDFDAYIEPFVGGASVALNIGKRYPRMILNDGNTDLIQFWEMIAKYPDEVSDLVRQHAGWLELLKSEEVYNQTRKTFNAKISKPTMRAAQFYFLNKRGFNGLIRYNSKGQFNVPHGNYKSFPLLSPEHLAEVSETLSKAELYSLDWKDLIDLHVVPLLDRKQKVLLYVDPPYIPISKTSSFTTYWKAFGIPDHEILGKYLDILDAMGASWILSNSKCSETERIFADYNFHEIDAQRRISCKNESRGTVKEYLITNF